MTKKIYTSRQADLIKAYALLFAGNRTVSLKEVLNTDISKLKSAYRNRIKENHPDRSKILGIKDHILTERFKTINHAYADLIDFIEKGRHDTFYHKNVKRTRSAYTGKTYTGSAKNKKHGQNRQEYSKNKNSGSTKTHYNGPLHNKKHARGNFWLPPKEILLGQYLYFSRIITLKTLIQAIIWQREQRPYFGAIALDWKILSKSDITLIHKQKKFPEKFGECALRIGLINSFQHRAILSKQKNIQKPIGQYFVEMNILTKEQLETHLKRLKKHNLSFKKKSYYK